MFGKKNRELPANQIQEAHRVPSLAKLSKERGDLREHMFENTLISLLNRRDDPILRLQEIDEEIEERLAANEGVQEGLKGTSRKPNNSLRDRFVRW